MFVFRFIYMFLGQTLPFKLYRIIGGFISGDLFQSYKLLEETIRMLFIRDCRSVCLGKIRGESSFQDFSQFLHIKKLS